ncbi:MAG: NADH-quinone oxidoreductase subunit N [Acidimicrobiia bacterium]|nr:NADH-quinone oxidoreductase subunit N [Acidimicrobiia bacterium]
MSVLAQAIPAPQTDYTTIIPELIVLGTGLLIVLMLAIRRFSNIGWYALIAALGFAAAGIVAYVDLWPEVTDGAATYAFSGMVAADGFSTFVVILSCVAGVLAVLLANSYLKREGLDKAEYFALLLFSAAGVQFMAMANNLVMVFLALEILSVCLYVLSAWNRDKFASQEAGMKYLLLGAYTSAIMLFGISFLYGGTGTLNIAALAQFFARNVLENQGLVFLGMALVVVGLAFKIAAVPFHMWAPDVYQGAPAPVVGYMAAAAKIAAFAALFRILFLGLSAMEVDWKPLLWGLAILSMIVGSLLALVQSDVKRMMAYSSISHAGFIAIGVAAASAEGMSGALFYLVTYTFMIAGAFAVIDCIGRKDEQYTKYEDYRGLFAREPLLAAILTFFLFALAGIPGTSGFVAKFVVFEGAAEGGQWALIGIGTVAAVIALFFYLRLIVLMYMQDSTERPDLAETRARVAAGPAVVLAVTVAATVLLGILPQGLLDMAGQAVFAL